MLRALQGVWAILHLKATGSQPPCHTDTAGVSVTISGLFLHLMDEPDSDSQNSKVSEALRAACPGCSSIWSEEDCIGREVALHLFFVVGLSVALSDAVLLLTLEVVVHAS
jgi:hypothetical protein